MADHGQWWRRLPTAERALLTKVKESGLVNPLNWETAGSLLSSMARMLDEAAGHPADDTAPAKQLEEREFAARKWELLKLYRENRDGGAYRFREAYASLARQCSPEQWVEIGSMLTEWEGKH